MAIMKRMRNPMDMLRLFDDNFMTRDFFSTTDFDQIITPAIDVEEKEGKYLVRADLPGIKKEDLHIEVQDGVLTLRGERREEREEKKGRYCRFERAYGSFERSFRVPENVTEKDIHAKYTDGVLELDIPAPQAKQQRKAIEVKID